MKTLLRFLVLRFLGWRVTALLALIGLARSVRSSSRRKLPHQR